MFLNIFGAPQSFVNELGTEVAAANSNCNYCLERFVSKSSDVMMTHFSRKLFDLLSNRLNLLHSFVIAVEVSQLHVPYLPLFRLVYFVTIEHGKDIRVKSNLHSHAFK